MQKNLQAVTSIKNARNDFADTSTIKSAPITLAPALLKHVSGGGSPNGNWANQVVATAAAASSPNGNW